MLGGLDHHTLQAVAKRARALLPDREVVDASEFGFKTSQSAALNKIAMDTALAAARGSGQPKIVWMPGGVFNVNGFTPPGTAPIATDYPSQGITLKGAGNGYQIGGAATVGVATILKFAAGVTSGLGAAQTYGIYVDNAKHWMNFEDFLIDGNAAIDYGLRICSQSTFKRITSRGCNSAGFRCQTIDSTHCYDLVATANPGAGMKIDKALATESTNTTPNTASFFIGCMFEGNTGIGLDIDQLLHSKFLCCVIQSNTSFGLRSKNQAGVAAMVNVEFDTCWWENNGAGVDKYQILIDSADVAPNIPSDNTFRNCRIDPLATNKTLHIVKGARNILDQIQYTLGATGAIDLDAGATDNVFKGPMNGTITDLGSRNYQYGRWKTPTFNAALFTGSGAMTWTVDAGDVSNFEYAVIEKTMHFNFRLLTTTIGGVADQVLSITLPDGWTLAKNFEGLYRFSNNGGAWTVGAIYGTAGSTAIQMIPGLPGVGNWAAGVNNNYLYGSITFEVQ